MQNLVPGSGLPSAGPDDPTVRRACDQCRTRKIRCDKDWPCSNCRTAKRSCTSTGVGQRPKEPRQRVLISSQYERKIDQIESRLGSIESLLKNLSTAQHLSVSNFSEANTPGTATGSSAPPTGTSVADFDSSDDESAFGGDAGLTAHTAFASDFLENAVQRTTLDEVNPNMRAALSNLSQLVDMHKHKSVSHGPRFPLQRPVPPGGLSKLPMPPMHVVVHQLKELKSGPPTLFGFTCALVGLTDFSGLCRLVYFPTDDFTQAQFTIVNLGLYNLFMERAVLTAEDTLREEYLTYARTCQANIETSLATLPLFLSPRVENVQALILGAQYAIDVARPSVAWHLNSTAAQLCQTGGYHRAEVAAADPPTVSQVKSILFWQAYTIDKGLSLRLGRASIIQDCDISIPRNFNFEGFLHLEETTIPSLWLKTSTLHGKIYERLYSPAALSLPPSALCERALELAAQCKSLENEIGTTRAETSTYLRNLNTSEIVEVFVRGDEVQFHATLTLVYRAIPAPEGSPGRFCFECLESARKAMKAHQDCIALMKFGSYIKSIYVHWTLMIVPFAPFFVIFCHVIETLSAEDLRILDEFVASMEQLRDASETVEKLYRVFQVMRDVAVVYVETKSEQQRDQTMIPIRDEFDMYLSQLGLMSTDDQAMVNPNTNQGPQVQQQASQMAGWFSGNRNMFGLIEEDLSQIDSNSWMQQG